MMGLIGAGNNPMVGMTVAVAVEICMLLTENPNVRKDASYFFFEKKKYEKRNFHPMGCL